VIAPSELPDPQMPPDATPTSISQPIPQRQVNSKDILQGDREIWIVHGQDMYRLRETKNGKLILQK
jgi:hemin uptake protein HemP